MCGCCWGESDCETQTRWWWRSTHFRTSPGESPGSELPLGEKVNQIGQDLSICSHPISVERVYLRHTLDIFAHIDETAKGPCPERGSCRPGYQGVPKEPIATNPREDLCFKVQPHNTLICFDYLYVTKPPNKMTNDSVSLFHGLVCFRIQICISQHHRYLKVLLHHTDIIGSSVSRPIIRQPSISPPSRVQPKPHRINNTLD